MTAVIESFVDNVTSVTGTSDPVVGLTAGSSVVACDALDGNRVRVIRGMLPLIGFDTNTGDFYTKFVTDNAIVFNQPLLAGEYVYIKTIPL